MVTGMDILMYLLACVGVMQIVCWIADLRARPKGGKKAYHLVPLYGGTGLERQVRHALSRSRWGPGGELLLLVDMGLDPAARRSCEELACGLLGVFLCSREDLSDTIAQLDHLQDI